MRRYKIFRKGKKLLCLFLVLALVSALLPSVAAIPASFFETHRDWHFDLSREPDRAMTVEEFVALTTAYSYWSVGSGGETPRDKNGDLPASWAAPYIRCEAQKGALHPEEIDYDAPATLAFIMKFTANSKGLEGFNAVNIHYEFSGTENLTTEEKLCLCAAVDYSLFPYTPGMDVSVTVPRRELEEKYKIPLGALKDPLPVVETAESYPHSMAFYEDCYWDHGEAVRQLEILKANKENFNIVSLDTIYLTEAKLAEKKSDSIRYSHKEYTRKYAADYIRHDYESYKERDPQLELIDFCKEQDICILGGVINWYDSSTMARIAQSDEALRQVVAELVDITLEYDLDGLNIDIELSGNTYRQAYSKLVCALSDALHAKGKILMLTVGGYMRLREEQTTLYDYEAIDRAADLITLITYDIFSARSYNAGREMGPISNALYSARCMRYASMYFGPERLLMGVASYGIAFNTTDHTAENITYEEVMALQRKHGAAPQCSDPRTDDCKFSFTEGGKRYTVYYESHEGMARRLRVPLQYSMGGAACFYLNSENSVQFAQIGERLRKIPFVDVSIDSWYYEGVKYAYENQLFSGITPTEFKPDLDMTRAMLVTVLWRYDGSPKATNAAAFSDVPAGLWYSEAVAWASSEGIVNGVGNGKFAPDSKLTRQQIATILYRYGRSKNASMDASANLSGFTDVQTVDGWALEAMEWAVGAGLIQGITATGQSGVRLSPKGNATRAQTATIFMRFITKVLE